MSTLLPKETRNYIANLSIGTPDTGAESITAGYEANEKGGPIEATNIDKLPEGVVTGSNLIQFSANTTPELRSSIALSLLLAQRAAAADTTVATPSQWVESHNRVLKNLGWAFEGGGEVDSEIEGNNLSVHKAIIPFLELAFGPAVAAATLIIGALKQLNTINADSPWITLFERNARRFDVREFQFTAVEQQGGKTTLTMVDARFTADFKVTQVLFFKYSSARAKFKSARAVLAANSSLLAAMSEDLEAKLHKHIKSYIASVDID